jgi:zinc protease
VVGARRAIAAAVTLALALGCAARPRTDQPPFPDRIARVRLAPTGFTADNGLRVLAISEPDATQLHVTVRYDVGAAADPPGKAGLAHLVEHVLFEHHRDGAASIRSRLEAIATYVNGWTAVDGTAYVTRARPDRLRDILALEAARLQTPCDAITDDDLAREREVVRNELRQGRTARHWARIAVETLLPAGHPYRTTVIGTEPALDAITRDDVCRFLAAYYAPSNAVVVVSGPVETDEVRAAVAATLGAIPRRAFTAAAAVPPLDAHPTRVVIDAPVDDPYVMLAWPLPIEPIRRARTLAIAEVLASGVRGEVHGKVRVDVIGGRGAELVVLGVEQTRVDADAELDAAIERGLADALASRDDDAVERGRGLAAYEAFRRLAEPFWRDAGLAADVMVAGRGPTDEVADQLAAASGMTTADADELARSLSYGRAAVIRIRPEPDSRGTGIALRGRPPHDDRRGGPSDPTGAGAPAVFDAAPDRRGTSRILPNGLRLIVLPTSSVPTIEVRLVLGSGTAAEPADQHGVASLAADQLLYPDRARTALRAAWRAGASSLGWVDRDATTFIRRGLAVHVDILLASVALLVREGQYDDQAVARRIERWRDHVRRARAARTPAETAAETAAADLVRAYYGDHPYASRATIDDVGADDVRAFRARHYKPDNATLIIAGGFDPAVAEPWAEYWFGDWEGSAAPRDLARARLTPTRVRHADDTAAQLELELAFAAAPAPAPTDRAAQVIAAEMLRLAVGDVRTQTAATYGVDAALIEERAATAFWLRGLVDRGAAPTALALLATRLAELRAGGEPVAAYFVAARRRILEELAAPATDATTAAEAAAAAAQFGRDRTDDLVLLEAVRTTTLADMAAVLAGFDPDRAVISIRGPAAELDAAFAALSPPPARRATPASPGGH